MRRIFVTAALLWLVFTSSAHAQRITEELGTFERATMLIVNWIKNISSALDDFVGEEKRSQFYSRLDDLNGALFRVEVAKRALLLEMRRTTDSSRVQENRTQFIAGDLIKQVGELNGAINEVAVLLRKELEAGGFECMKLLSDTSDEKASWLTNFASPMMQQWQNNPQLKAQLIARGEKAVEALRTASFELVKVQHRLR